MKYESLTGGFLIRRLNRFVAEVRLDDGREALVHVPNTGSMRSTRAPWSRVALSRAKNPNRKLQWTLELIRPEGGAWVGVNTAMTNRIVEEAIRNRRIAPLKGYDTLLREVPHGTSRIDFMLQGPTGRCFVEVKNVTFKQGTSALFPDAVTVRGTKHLLALRDIVRTGDRAVIFFLVNRSDCSAMRPAHDIDPVYARTLTEVMGQGVEAMAYRVRIDPPAIEVERKLKIYFNKSV